MDEETDRVRQSKHTPTTIPSHPIPSTHHHHRQVPTRLACLHWLAMLVEKAPKELAPSIEPVLLPALLRALADPSDDVVLLDLHVRMLGGWVRMGRVVVVPCLLFFLPNPNPSDVWEDSLAELPFVCDIDAPNHTNSYIQVLARISVLGDADFRRVLHAVLHLFQTDRYDRAALHIHLCPCPL